MDNSAKRTNLHSCLVTGTGIQDEVYSRGQSRPSSLFFLLILLHLSRRTTRRTGITIFKVLVRVHNFSGDYCVNCMEFFYFVVIFRLQYSNFKKSEKLDMKFYIFFCQWLQHLWCTYYPFNNFFIWICYVIEIEKLRLQRYLNTVISRHCLKHMSILDIQIDTRAYYISISFKAYRIIDCNHV